MLIAIRDTGIGLSAEGRAYAIDRVDRALGAVREHVRKVFIYLTDLNGPRGGVDKLCRIAVTLDAGRPVVVTTNAGSVTGVVDVAADKAAEMVQREVHRRCERRRGERLARALKQLKRLFGRVGGES